MIAAQAVIHFTPASGYAKYIKLVAGLIVLLMFLSPVYKILYDEEPDWEEKLTKEWEEFENAGLSEGEYGTYALQNSVIAGLEEEIKSKLNNSLSGENYSVLKVALDIDASPPQAGSASEDKNNASYGDYELNKVHVSVRAHGEGEDSVEREEVERAEEKGAAQVEKVEKIEIQKIDVGVSGGETDKERGEVFYDNGENGQSGESERLREKFCGVLGIGEEYMEVSIYGEAE